MHSVIGPCVHIEWDEVVEFIPIHPPRTMPDPFYTYDLGKDGIWGNRYNPKVVQSNISGGVRYELTYRKEDHAVAENLALWGTTVITIKGLDVTADWAGENGFKSQPKAQLIDQSDRVRTNAQPTVRNQTPLRKLLLATDRVCAISEEATPAALECAHLVSVKGEGHDEIGNAILLRADLHCLLDAGCFDISATGEIVIVSNELSQDYHKLLSGRQLSKSLISRVGAAIKQRSVLNVGPA